MNFLQNPYFSSWGFPRKPSISITKDQLISKGFFAILKFFQKHELVRVFFWKNQRLEKILSDFIWQVFWKNSRIAKSPFEINWPLVRLKIAQEFGDRAIDISKQNPTCIFTNLSSQKTRKKHSTLFSQTFLTSFSNCFKNTGYF